jgi:hypothetical protein
VRTSREDRPVRTSREDPTLFDAVSVIR